MQRLAFILALFLTAFSAAGQVITTVAGTVGISGYSGDGGAATAAKIGLCNGIAGDAAGNLYMADYLYHVVRKISPSGIITTIAGTGSAGYNGDGIPDTAAMLWRPFGIAVDATGNIFIADCVNQRIRKIGTSGIISTVAGTGVAGFSGDGGPATAAHITNPRDVVVDAIGNLYIADGGNDVVRKIDVSGIITTIAGTGLIGFYGEGVPATDARFNFPDRLMLDNAGNLYVADKLNNRLRVVNTAGIIYTVAGTGAATYSGDGGAATAAGLVYPAGMVQDHNGNMYIGCSPGSRVRRIDAAGTITTFAGGLVAGYSGDHGQALHAQLNDPWTMALHGDGEIYIADYSNFVIRLVHDDTVRFAGGHLQALAACDPALLSVPLAVHDADTGQRLHWSLLSAPAHGSATVAYTDTATGGTVAPPGLYYTPAAAYTGADTFKVRVYDGMLADTTMICVTVYATNPGTITGADTVCVGHTITLGNAVPGGIWSTGNAKASVLATGVVTGVSTGAVAVSYTVTNPCISASSVKPLYVLPAGTACTIATAVTPAVTQGIAVYPDPNNGVFTVVLPLAGTITITNLLGRQVAVAEAQAGVPLIIKLSAPPGSYVLSALTAEGVWRSQVQVVQ